MAADETLRRLARVAAATGAAVAPGAHEELLRSVAEAARALLDAEGCSIALLEGDDLVFSVVTGGAEEAVTGLRMPAGRGIAGWVVSSGQAIAVQDVQGDPRFARDVADSVGYAPRSIMAMPLETQRGTLGVIEVLDARGGSAAPDDLELLGVFARQAALAIEGRAVFARVAEVILGALAGAAEGDLADALREAASATDDPHLGELAALFAGLGDLGEKEQRAAVEILRRFVDYARSRRR